MGSSGQLYNLSWGEFGSSLISAVQLLRGDGDLFDVTLSAGGRSFSAHKVVLSAASPYLLDLFKNTPCKHPVVILAGISAEDLETILEFIYRGEINVDSSQLPSLLQAANYLSIRGLTPPTILSDKKKEAGVLAAASNNVSVEEETPPLTERKKRRRKKASNISPRKRKGVLNPKNEKVNSENKFNRRSPDLKGDENQDDGMNHRDLEMNNRGHSPGMICLASVAESLQSQDSTSDSEPPHLHTPMPMQYSPLHIPQYPATLGMGFPPVPCISQSQNPNQSLASVSSMNVSSAKIRGASDCPGVCPLCGATLRQARNLRRHLISSCKYRLDSFAGLRNQLNPELSMLPEFRTDVKTEPKQESDTIGYSGDEFRIEESNSCEQIICNPSPLPSPTAQASAVSPNKNITSPTIAR